jgi:DNA modification methylase
VIRLGAVGGGNIGSKLAHENEAPFPEALVECFIRCFCPPDGLVLDPFSGSATVPAVAVQWGRNAMGIDIRESQIELGHRRVAEVLGRAK